MRIFQIPLVLHRKRNVSSASRKLVCMTLSKIDLEAKMITGARLEFRRCPRFNFKMRIYTEKSFC